MENNTIEKESVYYIYYMFVICIWGDSQEFVEFSMHIINCPVPSKM